jgi:hypothetical protein
MYKNIFQIAMLLLIIAGCKKNDFVEANIDPSVAYSIKPENQFLNGSRSLFGNDFEAYYETYRNIMPWLQLATPTGGNLKNYTANSNPFSRYDNLYGRGGGVALYDVNVLINKLPSPQKESYQQLGAFARILLDYEFFYVSDIYGSLPYTHAFEGRYSLEFQVPYDNQQTIFNGIDADLKAAIQQIKTAPSGQFSVGDYDQFYFGDAGKWVKAANALRLRLAMRIMKRDAAKATAIIQEVLASPADDLMSSNADSWTFKAPSSFASGGNWNPAGLKATKALVDFMTNTDDPRTRIFFTQNMYSQENFNLAKDQGKIGAGATFNPQRYVGSYASPDSSANDKIQTRFYTTRPISKGGSNLSLDTLSDINPRLFQTAFNGGTGIQYFPLITYADFEFMRAELAARGTTSEDAAALYTAAVTASIKYYGEMAKAGQFLDYYAETGGTQVEEPTDAEIAAYLAQPEVAYNPAKGLDQILSQSFLNFFKESNEAWALVKRTGMPDNNTTLQLENLYYNGTLLAVPHRAPRTLPNTGDLNYANANAAFEEMQNESNYGSGPGDITGRVWWDVE